MMINFIEKDYIKHVCLKLENAAIISYKSLPLEKPVKKLIHLILHAISLSLGIWGICAAFKNHNESGIPNLYSLHSWIGIGVISLYAFQVNLLITVNSYKNIILHQRKINKKMF